MTFLIAGFLSNLMSGIFTSAAGGLHKGLEKRIEGQVAGKKGQFPSHDREP